MDTAGQHPQILTGRDMVIKITQMKDPHRAKIGYTSAMLEFEILVFPHIGRLVKGLVS
jgi:hypothetical protein